MIMERRVEWLRKQFRRHLAPHRHSALLVAIPSAEPAVARHRDRFDSSAPRGVPAHITVLFPWRLGVRWRGGRPRHTYPRWVSSRLTIMIA